MPTGVGDSMHYSNNACDINATWNSSNVYSLKVQNQNLHVIMCKQLSSNQILWSR